MWLDIMSPWGHIPTDHPRALFYVKSSFTCYLLYTLILRIFKLLFPHNTEIIKVVNLPENGGIFSNTTPREEAKLVDLFYILILH